MAEVRLIYCGRPRWASNNSNGSAKMSYVYANDAGREVEVVVWGGPSRPGITLYPAGINERGQVRDGASGHIVNGLMTAQLEALEILSRE